MRIAAGLLLGAMAGLGGAAASPTPPARPVVVELFTSEGCSSCPPADAFLGELARERADVLPLAFHITYWDSLGWRDPYALPQATERQRAYAPRLSRGTVYTPQMVIDGTTDVVGSEREQALGAIATAARSARMAVPMTLSPAPDGFDIRVGAGAGSGRLLLVGYDRQHRTAVARGENAGRQLAEANVVRAIDDLGPWQGEKLTLRHPRVAGEAFALLLQAPDGRILGAVRADLLRGE